MKNCHPGIFNAPEALPVKCQAVQHGGKTKCRNWARNGSYPYCGVHANWNFYGDESEYPIQAQTHKIVILARQIFEEEAWYLVAKPKAYCQDVERKWKPASKLTEHAKMIDEWDTKHDVPLEIHSWRFVPGTNNRRVRVRYRYYPAREFDSEEDRDFIRLLREAE